MNGRCQNNCPRLATVEVYIDALGKRHLCHFCQEALQPLFGVGMRPVDSLPEWRRRSLAKDFSGSAA